VVILFALMVGKDDMKQHQKKKTALSITHKSLIFNPNFNTLY
jgi:hypothetical protein